MGSQNRGLSWLDWLNTLLMGLLLAGLQGLVALPMLLNGPRPWPWLILLGGGALSAALLPGYASWLATTQTGKLWAGFTSGCTAGLLGFVLFTLLFVCWYQLQLYQLQLQRVPIGLFGGWQILVEVFLEWGVGGALAIGGIMDGINRGLSQFEPRPQASEVVGTASEEEA